MELCFCYANLFVSCVCESIRVCHTQRETQSGLSDWVLMSPVLLRSIPVLLWKQESNTVSYCKHITVKATAFFCLLLQSHPSLMYFHQPSLTSASSSFGDHLYDLNCCRGSQLQSKKISVHSAPLSLVSFAKFPVLDVAVMMKCAHNLSKLVDFSGLKHCWKYLG